MLKKLSQNPFEEFGVPNAEIEKAKVEAVAIMLSGLTDRGWRTADLARAAAIPEAEMRDIFALKLDGYSIEKLNQILAVFGNRVQAELPDQIASTRSL